jgi:hypothetical protein
MTPLNQRLIVTISCCVLLIAVCARVESRPRHSSKKPKPSAAREKSEPAKSAADVRETTETDVPPEPQPSPDPGWEFSVAPYFFLPSLDGTVGVVGQRAEVNATFRDLFRNLDFALMGQFEARKGNWSILADGMYMSLSGDRVTPSPFFGDIAVEVKEAIIEPAVAYRVLNTEGGSIDVLGGVRFWHVNTHLTFQPRILPLVDVEGSKNWADPIIGARGTAKLSPRVFLLGRFDVGGFGAASDFTGQVFGGAGFQVKPRVALIGGYRYLRVDYFNEGFIYKTALNGIVLGAKFKL